MFDWWSKDPEQYNNHNRGLNNVCKISMKITKAMLINADRDYKQYLDGRDAEGDLFDLQHITLKLVNNEHVRVSVDRFEDTYLDIETVKYVGDDTSESQRFDHFRKPINEMSYGELRKMETMTLTQPRTREERHACLDARNYLREKPPKFEKQRLAEERWRNAYKRQPIGDRQ